MKLTITGDRLALIKRMFTKAWAIRSNAKLKSLKTKVVIEAGDDVINLILKQKRRFFDREELKIEVDGDTTADN